MLLERLCSRPWAAVLFIATAACADPSREAPPLPAGAIPHGTQLGAASIAGSVTYTGEVRPA